MAQPMRAVVVGALGVIGRYIVERLLAEPDRSVVGLSRRPAADAPCYRHISLDLLDDLEAWPGVRTVGEDGAHAAWLIAQLGDRGLQERALEHLEVAVDFGDAPPAHHAFLLDRVRMATGRPQVYGSQMVLAEDGDLAPWPIEDPAHVDERRAHVGLGPLAAHTAQLREQRARSD